MTTPTADPRAAMARARLACVDPVADGLAVFTLHPESAPTPAFVAGQAMPLAWEHEGRPVVRHYSIASAPEQRDRLEFYVVRSSRPGAASADLFRLTPGDPLWFGAPGGAFTLARTRRRHLALVATGTGLAPYISMLRHLEAAGRRDLAVSLWHGVRVPADLGYRAELERLESRRPFPFLYLPTASRFGSDQRAAAGRVSRGRVDELLARVLGLPPAGDARGAELAPEVPRERLARFLPRGETAIFLCGNPNMIRALAACAAGTPWEAELIYDRWW